MHYTFYTDGSCWPNPGGTGGWGWVCVDAAGVEVRRASGQLAASTNNRAELVAVLQALASVGPDATQVTVHTDSMYVVWSVRAAQRGDLTKRANPDLLDQLRQALARLSVPVQVTWCRGHAGNPYNELADQLAGEARAAQG